MELQEIDVFVEKDGQIRIEVRGVKGMSCLDLTKDLEAVLGDRITGELSKADVNKRVGCSVSANTAPVNLCLEHQYTSQLLN